MIKKLADPEFKSEQPAFQIYLVSEFNVFNRQYIYRVSIDSFKGSFRDRILIPIEEADCRNVAKLSLSLAEKSVAVRVYASGSVKFNALQM